MPSDRGDETYATGTGAPERALILAGGGMRVAWQAGVLRALAEHGLAFRHADGTSGGIMNLAAMLSGVSAEELCERWATLHLAGFVSLLPLRQYLRPARLVAVGDADGIVGKVFPHLGIDVERINKNREPTGTFNVCNFATKRCEAVSHEDVDLDLLVAGISLPGLMPPVYRDGVPYTDAVWIKDANLLEAVRRGAEELWLLWCIGNTEEYRAGPFQQYVQMIEMSAAGALLDELDQIADINRRRRAGEPVHGHTRPVTLHVVKPAYPLPLDPEFYFGRIDAATLVAMGYRDACAYLAARSPDGVPLDDAAIRMRVPPDGLRFRERMTGTLDWSGRTAVAEDAVASRTTLDLTVEVVDLDAFRGDPTGGAALVGHLDDPRFSWPLLVTDGSLRIVPADDASGRELRYEARFTAEGTPFCLRGVKRVVDPRLPRRWEQVTTVATTVHEGDTADGPEVARGVLRLERPDTQRLLRSVQPTGGTGVLRRRLRGRRAVRELLFGGPAPTK